MSRIESMGALLKPMPWLEAKAMILRYRWYTSLLIILSVIFTESLLCASSVLGDGDTAMNKNESGPK